MLQSLSIELYLKTFFITYSHWRDVSLDESIYDAIVVFQSFLVDWIVSSSKRDNSRPSDRKTVCIGVELLQQSDVLSPVLPST